MTPIPVIPPGFVPEDEVAPADVAIPPGFVPEEEAAIAPPPGFVPAPDAEQPNDPLFSLPFPLPKIEAYVELQRRPPLERKGPNGEMIRFDPEPDRAALEAMAAPIREYLAQQKAPAAPDPAMDSTVGAGQQVANRFARGAVNDGILTGVQGIAQMDASGASGGAARQIKQESADMVGRAKKAVEEALPINPDRTDGVEGFVGDVAAGVGQMVGNAPAAFASGGILNAQLSVGQMFQQAYEDAKSNGATEEQAAQAGLLSVPAAAVEAMADRYGLSNAVKGATKAVMARHVARKIAEGFASEGGTESAQQAWGNLIANSLVGYDPERSTGEGVAYAGAVGGVTGATIQGVPSAVGAGARAGADALTRPADEKLFDNPDQAASILSAEDRPNDPAAIPPRAEQPAVSRRVADPASSPDAAAAADEDTQRVARWKEQNRERFEGLTEAELDAMARQQSVIERDLAARDAAAQGRNNQRGADRMFTATQDEAAKARQEEIDRQAAALREELGEDALDLPTSQEELDRLKTSARRLREVRRQEQAEEARAEKLKSLEGMSDAELADYALDGDPDARNYLLAVLDGNEDEANRAIADAQERRAAEEQDRLSREEEVREMEDTLEDGAEDILSAVKSLGGLPVPDSQNLSGELKSLREASKGAWALFRKGAKNLDRLREALVERGFQLDTEDDVIQAVEDQLAGRRTVRAVARTEFSRRTQATPTVPERLPTLKAQMAWLRAGKRRAVNVPYPAALNVLDTEGLSVIQVEGEGAFVFDPARITEADIRRAVQEDRVGDILDYGTSRKPERPVGAVVIRDAAGREKQAVIVDRESAPAAARAARRMADPGDTVTLEDPAEVLRYRTGQTAPMRLASGEAVRSVARQWEENLRRIAPGIANQITLKIEDREAFRRDMAAQGYDLRQLTGDEQAAMDSHRAILYLVSEHLLTNDSETNLINIQHELAHHFWNTLTPEIQQQLAVLHAQEVASKTGPLYENGRLRKNMADGVEDVGTEYGLKEWFAERMARANHDWAQSRIEGQPTPEEGWIDRLARAFRDVIRRAITVLRPELTGDDVLRDFRRYLLQGSRWDAEGDGTSFVDRSSTAEGLMGQIMGARSRYDADQLRRIILVNAPPSERPRLLTALRSRMEEIARTNNEQELTALARWADRHLNADFSSMPFDMLQSIWWSRPNADEAVASLLTDSSLADTPQTADVVQTYEAVTEKLADLEAALVLSREQDAPASPNFLDEQIRRDRLQVQRGLRGINADLREQEQQNTDRALTRLAELWKSAAEEDSVWTLGRSNSKDMQQIARDMAPDTEIAARRSGADGKNWVLERRKAGEVTSQLTITVTGNRASIYAEESTRGGGGSDLYQIAFTWMANNGLKNAPYNGATSWVNRLRRTSNMISSALRMGTTAHLEPADQQKVQWREGDHLRNIGALLQREKALVFMKLPQLKAYRADTDTGAIYDAEGNPVTLEQLEETIASLDPKFRKGIGARTAYRAIMTQEVFNGLMEGIVPALAVQDRILYARRSGQTPSDGVGSNQDETFSRRDSSADIPTRTADNSGLAVRPSNNTQPDGNNESFDQGPLRQIPDSEFNDLRQSAASERVPNSSEVALVIEFPDRIIKAVEPTQAIHVGNFTQTGNILKFDTLPSSPADIAARAAQLSLFNSGIATKVLGQISTGHVLLEQPKLGQGRSVQRLALNLLLRDKRAVQIRTDNPDLISDALEASYVVRAPDQNYYFVSDLRDANVGRFGNEGRAFDLIIKPITAQDRQLSVISDAIAQIEQGKGSIDFARRPDPATPLDQAQLESQIAELRVNLESARTDFAKQLYREKIEEKRVALAELLRKSGQPATDHDALVDAVEDMGALSIEAAFAFGPIVRKSFSRLYMGASDIFAATPGLEFLGKAVRRHVDLARGYQGRYLTPFRRWQQKYSRKVRKQALKEFEAYWQRIDSTPDRGAGDDSLVGLSAPARELVKTWQRIAAEMGQINQKNTLVVFDDDKYGEGQGGFRPIGNVPNYFPRSLRPEVRLLLADPSRDMAKWKDIVRALMAGGYIQNPNEAQKYLARAFKNESSSDYMANIESARRLELPAQLYDYSFDAARRYILGWSERMAQIEAFGQKVGPQGKDLFDIALGRSIDTATREYIDAVRQRAYNLTPRNLWARSMAFLNALATGTLLSNPVTVGVNIISGLSYNATTMGPWHALKGAAELRSMARIASEIEDAYERGILMDDLLNMQHDAQMLDSTAVERAQSFASGALTVSGFAASESFVRAHSLVTAKAFMRDAVRHWNKNTGSRAARLYIGWFQRNGFDYEKLIAEQGTGPETDRFLRGAVNIAQGGYRYDQVPVYVETPVGRFLFKFQKWGTQMSRNFVINAIRPLINPGTDRQGRPLPRDIKPLVSYLMITALVGLGVEELKEWIFGTANRGADWDEITRTMDEDTAQGLALAASRIFGAMLGVGAFGMFGNYSQVLTDFADRYKFKNPIDPPGLATVKNAGEILFRAWEQKRLTLDDLNDISRSQFSMWRTGQAAGARLMDAFGVDARWSANEMARQDVAWLGKITRRFSDEMGTEGSRMSIARRGKTENSPFYDGIHKALMRGDIAAAQTLLDDYLTRYPEDSDRAFKSLSASINARRPIRVGGYAGEDREVLFYDWATRRLAAEDLARIREIDDRYKGAARALGLIKPEEFEEKDLTEIEDRITWKARKKEEGIEDLIRQAMGRN